MMEVRRDYEENGRELQRIRERYINFFFIPEFTLFMIMSELQAERGRKLAWKNCPGFDSHGGKKPSRDDRLGE